jgi:hypothetical protein
VVYKNDHLERGRIMKECRKCEEVKPLASFSKRSFLKSGSETHCKTCERARKLKALYGMTPEDYSDIMDAQQGRCGICHKEETLEGSTFNVDHDHETGIIRGILCGPCNRGIGLLQDSPEVIGRAWAYLKSAPSIE